MFGFKTGGKVCKTLRKYADGWEYLAEGYAVGSKYRANLSIVKSAGKFSKELTKLQNKYPNLDIKDLELIK